jgi:hypothetical protein
MGGEDLEGELGERSLPPASPMAFQYRQGAPW